MQQALQYTEYSKHFYMYWFSAILYIDVIILKNEETKPLGGHLAKDGTVVSIGVLLFKLIKRYIRCKQGDLPHQFSQWRVIDSAARNSVGRKPSADRVCKNCLYERELTPSPQGGPSPVASGDVVERLSHPIQDGSSLTGHISSRGYCQASIAPCPLGPACLPFLPQILIARTLTNKYHVPSASSQDPLLIQERTEHGTLYLHHN